MAGGSANSRHRSHQDSAGHPAVGRFVGRLIGTICRECLDRTPFWTAADLEMKLLDFCLDSVFCGHRSMPVRFNIAQTVRTPIRYGRVFVDASQSTERRF
jgi:hypothetical protein